MARRSKFNATPTVVDGIRFDSRAEARQFRRLRQMEDAGKIADLILQPEFPFEEGGKVQFTYRADFAYRQNGSRRVIDVKGVKTPLYRLKKKLIEARHEVVIEEIPA